MNEIVNLENKIVSPEVLGQLSAVIGGDDKAKLFAGSVLAEVKRTAGDPKKDLTGCSPDSIIQSMMDAANFGLAIDGRKHAHLVKYNNAVQLQIGYAGYVAKLTEAYPDADITTNVIFEGDQLDIDEKNGYQSYTFKRKNALENDPVKIIGAFAVISYTKGGEKIQKVTTMARAEINLIRSKAKQDFVWKEWFVEKTKIAVLRRACKLPFQSIMGLQKLLDYDNRNFDLEQKKLPRPQTDNIIDNINMAIEQEKIKDQEIIQIESRIHEEDISTPLEEKEVFEQIVIEQPKQTFKIYARGKETEIFSIDLWRDEVKNILKEYTDIRQFSLFVQKNKKNIDEIIAAGGQAIADEINTYMIELQSKIHEKE